MLTDEFLIIRRRNALARTAAAQPEATRSQIWSYYTESGQQLAVVHQYMRPDGTLGSAGLPDPKWLFEDGVAYFVP